MSHPFDLTSEEMQERAGQLAAMSRHGMMRNSAVVGDETLADYLKTATIEGTSMEGQFAGFKVTFGFDEQGRDFIVIKDVGDEDGMHLLIVDEESY